MTDGAWANSIPYHLHLVPDDLEADYSESAQDEESLSADMIESLIRIRERFMQELFAVDARDKRNWGSMRLST